MPVLEIKAQNFIAGESKTEYIADAGFSPSSYGLNLTKIRGLAYFIEAPTQIGASVLVAPGDIIAQCIDPIALGNDSYMVDTVGSFYTLNGTTLVKGQASTGYSYLEGTTDILGFKGTLYATSQNAIAQLGSNLSSITEDWWSNLQSGYRHPLEVIEGEMFIADNNIIWYWNGESSGTAFTLPPGAAITSLRRHSDGRTLLAFTGDNEQNASHILAGGGKVYYCDPVLRDWVREVSIESQVEGTRVVGGVIYVTYGYNFGYFDGNGLQPIKYLSSSSYTYSHNIGNMEDTLIIRDGNNTLAYGDLGAGKVWYNIFQDSNIGTTITNIFYLGDNNVIFATSDSKLFKIDYDNVGTNGRFYSNKYTFGSEVKIRRIDVFHTPSVADVAGYFNFYNIDMVTELVHSNTGQILSVNKTRINCDITADIFQFLVTISEPTLAIKLFRIYYDPIK